MRSVRKIRRLMSRGALASAAAVLLWLPASPCRAADSGASLAATNRSYRDGDYAQAAAAYGELLRSEPENPYLHYNLANAYFKEAAAGDLGRAIAEYWKAFRAMPRDPDIRQNFDFALRRAGESLVPAGTPQALHWAFYAFSEAELLGLQWIGYWLCLLLGSAYLLRSEFRGRLGPWIACSLAFWAFFGSWWGLRRAGGATEPGVILEANAEVRSGPGMNFPVTFNAPEGRRLQILSQSGDWLEIGVLKEGLKGWVAAKAVEKL